MSLLGHLSKVVSTLLSKLSDCPNTDTLLCYYNYPFLAVHLTFLSTGAIAVAIDGELFSGVGTPILISEVECTGLETDLLHCQHSTESLSSCGSLEQAAIVCQGKCVHQQFARLSIVSFSIMS